ncbi:uncharacterized protein [Epargyreus clarus]|uniref:uncharacterized protein isoform X1 n=1 Tax=Epargyreus clarus TaxID=520877 RepID=UPI003C2DE3ED
MDEELLSVKAVKPFRNTHNKFETINCKFQPKDQFFEPLTTKNAVKFLLEGNLKYRVCRYCLNVASRLSELDEIFEVGRKGAIYKVTLRDMIATVHPFKVINDPNFPDKICGTCVESTISAYLFSQQCERAERALRNCFEDIYEKFEKLDPLERGRKRGRQKAHPNTNVLYAEHELVTDYAEPIINIINLGSTTLENVGEINELECPKCWQVLPNVEALLNHDNLHPKNMWFNCKLCGQSFVKQRHYKRHIKDVHQHGTIIPERTTTNFKCNECGFMSSSVSQHLQHMEKHKFKTTFEHLVNRRMNQMCAMCLEKGTCMIHLNESIHLSGGYPGLNNEQSIYNIVSSTIPERKSYKYQELLIPTRANIITITKRMDVTQGKNFTAIYEKDKKMFHFCKPIILSTLKIEFETLYIFILSEPYMISQIGSFKINKNSLINETNALTTSNSEISQELSNVVATQSNSMPINSNNIMVDTNRKETIDEVNLQLNSNKDIDLIDLISSKDAIVEEPEGPQKKTVKLCKTCWIFNKPSCKECIKNKETDSHDNEGLKEIDVKTSEQEKCKYCWLFESVGKCNTCKKILKSNIETKVTNIHNSNDQITTDFTRGDNDSFTKCNITTEYEFGEEKSDLNSTLIKNTRKRKSNLEVSITRKLQWQCHICLTNNYETRETCFCCEFACIPDNKVKFNFGKNKDFFETPKIQKKTITQDSYDNASSNTKEIGDEKLLATSFQNAAECSNTQNADMCMDVEIQTNETQNFDNINAFIKEESMDICYEEPSMNPVSNLPTNTPFYHTSSNMSIPANTSLPFTPFVPSAPFQFNIGATHVNERFKRNIRPLRRIANKGHK